MKSRRPYLFYLLCRQFQMFVSLSLTVLAARQRSPHISINLSPFHLSLSLSYAQASKSMKNDKEITASDQPIKPRRPKSREVSSRYLSPPSTPTHDSGIPSPTQGSSPMRRKPSASSHDSRKHQSLEELGFARGSLWPSATAISSPSRSSSKKLDTLADHLGNDRLNDHLDRKGRNKVASAENSAHLSRQRSGTKISRIENVKGSSKENNRPIIGGSMRYTGKLLFPGRKSSSSNKGSDSPAPTIPGRFSVDENALYKKSSNRKSDSFTDHTLESESECSDVSSSASNLSSTTTMGKAGIEVSSRYMNDVTGRSSRRTSDSNVQHPLSFDETTRSNKFTVKGAIKRASSLAGYRSATSQWALSPGRSGSSPVSVENYERPLSFSSLKPPSSPSRHNGVEKLLNMGLDLFKIKKPSSHSSPLSPAGAEHVHQLRLLHNRLIQWQYVNAKANAANSKITSQAERNLACAWSSLTKLQHSVLQKKLQMEKEKFQMKLNLILYSQIRPLETWGDVERQHLLAISKTTESLQSIVCRLPLIEGAEVKPRSTSFALRHALDLTTSIKSAISDISPLGDGTVSLLSELANVVGQEKLLLEECLEYLRTISTLEIQERSLTCSMIQMNLWWQQQQQEEQVQLQRQQNCQ
ncbi:QWRF motif-containing protein 3 [Eucalyptus grandis]|uniref:QWRF motif-containing protein 3 n=1 Tax=Eucalyptus grandis TaxID=71139 RepID=UPI00192EC4AF|nr:QWRF motif-containing protein 3 [Eucalyptus grandis]